PNTIESEHVPWPKYSSNKMNVLVTGSCGFIGTNLCQSLLSDGHSVTGVDSFTENYAESIKRANQRQLEEYPSFKNLEVDLLESNLESIVDGKDVIFHLAGQPSVHNSWGEDFQVYSNRNIVLTQKLLRAANDAGTARFVNSSSSSIYGRVHSTPTKESDEKRPISPYGVTKLAAENLVTLYGSEFGLSTVSLRYFTVFGPRQRPDMAFNKLIQAGSRKRSFPLHGDGSQIRDFTFVGDVVEANKLAAFADVKSGSVFNIGGGAPVSMSEAIEMLEEIMGQSIAIEFTPLGPGNPMVTAADCTAAGTTLGWKPKMDIYDGLKAQVAWQLEQA
ncbi:MAG: NAD-dependent epimerase/dehydratase family protein, partial [Streptomycetaceae bacterium]